MGIETVYLGFGSNLGEKRENCYNALLYLKRSPEIFLRRLSSLYKTDPVGFKEQDWFLNGVVELETSLTPGRLFRLLKDIEKRVGRYPTFPMGPRVIDLDILLYGSRIVKDGGLEIPHPRMHERGFVLYPLVEIAPGAFHPVLKKTARELLDSLKDREGVEFWGSFTREELEELGCPSSL